jgi:hypothetical protein
MRYKEQRRSFKTARALARAVVSGRSFVTDTYYFLTTSDDEDDLVAVLDTTAPVGPASGTSIWVLEVQPHSWAAEVADYIWSHLDWDEVTEDSDEPSDRVGLEIWRCRIRVEITY